MFAYRPPPPVATYGAPSTTRPGSRRGALARQMWRRLNHESYFSLSVLVRFLLPPRPAPNLQNKVYKYPDLWICPYVQYGCDTWELEEGCANSAWETEGGPPDAVFYPRETLDQLHQVTTEELQIPVSYNLTNYDEVTTRTLQSPRTAPSQPAMLCCYFFGS